jgi:hypothetical protein
MQIYICQPLPELISLTSRFELDRASFRSASYPR